jgi:hypothetical protein
MHRSRRLCGQSFFTAHYGCVHRNAAPAETAERINADSGHPAAKLAWPEPAAATDLCAGWREPLNTALSASRRMLSSIVFCR